MKQSWSLSEALEAEITRARLLFPDPSGLLAALFEEVGELSKAMLDEPASRVRAEALQVAAVALRIYVEGDPTLEPLRKSRGLDSVPMMCRVGKLERIKPEES